MLLAIALTTLASLETATRRGTLYALCATALAGSCGWMIAAPFERVSFVLLLIATLFLLTVSANFNVFESAFDIEIQFLMNVLAILMVFDINMHVKM